jgi:hypothetical protein
VKAQRLKNAWIDDAYRDGEGGLIVVFKTRSGPKVTVQVDAYTAFVRLPRELWKAHRANAAELDHRSKTLRGECP